MMRNNGIYNIILTDHKHLDTDPTQFIKEVKSDFNNTQFVLINDDALNDSSKLEFLRSGYSSIINSSPNRTTLFRTIHALIAGTNIHENTNSLKVNEEKKPYKNSNKKLNILVGEDNKTNQKVVKNILEHGNHTVTIVENGELVLDELENEKYDLIILDMHMPVLGGIEAAKIFRFMSPQNKNIPIIMLTANATREAIDACKEAKLDAYLTKPVEPDKLLNTISSLVGDSEVSKKNAGLNIVDINDPDNLPIVDRNSINTLFSISKDKKFIKNLIDGYIHDAISTLDQLTLSAQNSEYLITADLAHVLDGSSRSIGAKRLAKSADKLFRLMKTEDRTTAIDEITELKSIFEKTKTELYTILKAHNSSNAKNST